MPRKPRSRSRNLAEYGFTRALELALRPLPMSVALRVGRALGWLTWKVDRQHRGLVEANAAWALGLDRDEARRFARRVFRNTGATSVESLMLPHVLRRRPISDFTRFEGEEHIRAALARGRGLIMITAHLGNWEIAGLALAAKVGSMVSVARGMSNPLLDRHLRRVREQLGQTIVDRRGALRPVVQQLRDGGVVGMLIDQNQRKGGVFVDFFGRLASTVPSPAAIALKYDVPVIAGYGCRVGDGFFHHLQCDRPFELIRTGDHEADVVANTAQFTRRIEEYIRRCPDQWLWLHSRWRHRPIEEKKAMKEAREAAEAAALGRSNP